MGEGMSNETQLFARKCHHKLEIAEIKVMLLYVVYGLLEDQAYTREEATKELFEVIKRLEEEEQCVEHAIP
ncbi:hypothetical protein [Caldalkalibacillus salinus]|uniref:hypothetical protein n=1 Tax=Caldalkalibacillus salinus TaxID=2803787 RepID=UPI0019210A73|nr:hypothetical protein [Caldalkalibacillus salinus]